MTDAQTIARRYIDLWNERTPARRREILAANWAKDARYVDPLMSGDGHDGVDALIAGVQQRFPDFKFSLIGEPNGYGDHVRFFFPGGSAPTAPTARSRALILPWSATAASAASPASSIRCLQAREPATRLPGDTRAATIHQFILGTFRALPHRTPIPSYWWNHYAPRPATSLYSERPR